MTLSSFLGLTLVTLVVTANTIQQHVHVDIADNDTDSQYTDPYIHNVTRFANACPKSSLQSFSKPAPARGLPRIGSFPIPEPPSRG